MSATAAGRETGQRRFLGPMHHTLIFCFPLNELCYCVFDPLVWNIFYKLYFDFSVLQASLSGVCLLSCS